MDKIEREKDLILRGSPCNVNYFDRKLLTIRQAIDKGETYCPNFDICNSQETYCSLRSALEIAQNVVKGRTLERELKDFSEADFINEECWNSKNGKEFYKIKGKAKWLDAVERFARIILLMNPSESVFPRCGTCYGVKLTKEVSDSIHDGSLSLSGSGKTVRRNVEYCPECEPEPRGGFLKSDPRDDEDIALIKKFGEQNK